MKQNANDGVQKLQIHIPAASGAFASTCRAEAFASGRMLSSQPPSRRCSPSVKSAPASIMASETVRIRCARSRQGTVRRFGSACGSCGGRSSSKTASRR